MNSCNFIGNLARDPELKTTSNKGTSKCSFTIAVGSGHKGEDGKEDVDFIPIVTYRQQAENCGKYLHKGSPVGVTGRLSVRPFTDREGNKRYITEVVADRVKFLSGGSGRQREPGEEDEGYTPPANMHEIEEDLPF